jgi:transposase
MGCKSTKEAEMTEMTRLNESTASATILMALELGIREWKLTVTVLGVRREQIRHKTIAAGDLVALLEWVATVRQKTGVSAATPVWSCYEAGRDGFWIHRALEAQGIQNLVVDAASIEVSRRRRRARTDRLDGEALVALLERYWRGEQKALRPVRVPSEAEEDGRELHRELESVKRARVAVGNRIGSLLATHGVRIDLGADGAAQLAAATRWDGSALPPQLSARLQREWQAYEGLTARIRGVEAERREAVRAGTGRALDQVRQLRQVRAVGDNSAWLFVFELFGWRQFQNRRQVGAVAGLAPTPWSSGEVTRELGISGAGNARVRTMAIEIAWGWLRFQPQSALTRWYQARFGSGSARMRRIGIVALARKLLIAFWRFLETGVLPDGALLKA